MRVLIACEFSGVVRDAFTAAGHDATSCDLLPCETPGQHYQGDVRDVLHANWDLMVAHPPCTHLSVSGARWFREKNRPDGAVLWYAYAQGLFGTWRQEVWLSGAFLLKTTKQQRDRFLADVAGDVYRAMAAAEE